MLNMLVGNKHAVAVPTERKVAMSPGFEEVVARTRQTVWSVVIEIHWRRYTKNCRMFKVRCGAEQFALMMLQLYKIDIR